MEKSLREMTVAELVETWNGIRPDEPLTGWKQGKDKLIARIENEAHVAAFLSARVVEVPETKADDGTEATGRSRRPPRSPRGS